MAQVAWMFCLFVRLFSAFPFTLVFTDADFNVDKRAGQVHETYQFAERHLPANAHVREVIRPRIGEDDAVVGSRSIQVPYYFLPMFQHSAIPLVDRNVFKPVAGRIQLPTALTNLLLPQQNSPELNSFYPVRNPRGVEVWCGYNHISVRVNRGMLGFRSLASMFFLGTCPVTRVTPFLFYFHYNLNDCGSTQTTVNGQMVYSNSLHYSPLSKGSVIRAIPLNLPIQCIYNRFHYSYKVGYVPEVHERTFLKSMKSKRSFRLTACNGPDGSYVHKQSKNIWYPEEVRLYTGITICLCPVSAEWKHLSSEESYMLGEPMYFEAYAAFVPQSQRVFVDSCFVTPFKNPNTVPRFEVIHNFGCMVDSKREGSQSQFFSREANVLLFTVDAFLFPQITDKHLYLHCNITVEKSIPTMSAKSCTYNSALQRWEELYGSSSVCSCCDSVCEVSEFWPAKMSPSLKSLITSEAWRVLDKNVHFQAEVLQESEVRVKESKTFKTLAVTSGEVVTLEVAPWKEDKNTTVTPMDEVEVKLKHWEEISRQDKEKEGKLENNGEATKVEELNLQSLERTLKMRVIEEVTQESAFVVTEAIVDPEVAVEAKSKDKQAEKEVVMVEADKGTDQVTESVLEGPEFNETVHEGIDVTLSENTVMLEVVHQNMSSELGVATIKSKVLEKMKAVGGEQSKVERGFGLMPLEDEEAAFLQGYMEPAEWKMDYQGPDLEWTSSTKDMLAVLEMSVPTGNTDVN